MPHASAPPRELSPDPFPLIQPLPAVTAMTAMQPPPVPPVSALSDSVYPDSHANCSSSFADYGLNPLTPKHQSSRAVDRARKRLRGEPVSPSPVKEKRPRTVASQSTLNFIQTVQGGNSHKRASQLLFDEQDDSELSDGGKQQRDRDDPAFAGAMNTDRGRDDDITIEATPMKPPKGGKAFVALFQDIIPSDQDVILPISGRSRLPQSQSIQNILGRPRSTNTSLSTSSGSDKTASKSKLRQSLSRVSSISEEDVEDLDALGLGPGLGNGDSDEELWRSVQSGGSSPSSGQTTTKLKALNLSSSSNVLDQNRNRSQTPISNQPFRKQKNGNSRGRPVLPGKDDLKSSGGPSTSSAAAAATGTGTSSARRFGRGTKRTSSDVEMGDAEMDEEPENGGAFGIVRDEDDVASGSGSGTKGTNSRNKSSATSSRSFRAHGHTGTQSDTNHAAATKNQKAIGKGKAKALSQAVSAISRKKAKLLAELGDSDEDGAEDDSEDGDPEEGENGNDGNVKVLDWSWQRRPRQRQDVELDEDYDLTARPHYSHPHSLSTQQTDLDSSHSPTSHYPQVPTTSEQLVPVADAELEGSCEVNLPSDLARVLALSPSHTSSYIRDKTEQKVVKELLYGRRERHYDPQRGGIVYDVGEEDQSEGAEGGEDDWEGEPVPWEVGEL